MKKINLENEIIVGEVRGEEIYKILSKTPSSGHSIRTNFFDKEIKTENRIIKELI